MYCIQPYSVRSILLTITDNSGSGSSSSSSSVEVV